MSYTVGKGRFVFVPKLYGMKTYGGEEVLYMYMGTTGGSTLRPFSSLASPQLRR
jgi:hypothetical protein